MAKLKLTRREISIMRMVGQKKSILAIKQRLHIQNEDEVKTLISSVILKLGFNASQPDEPEKKPRKVKTNERSTRRPVKAKADSKRSGRNPSPTG